MSAPTTRPTRAVGDRAERGRPAAAAASPARSQPRTRCAATAHRRAGGNPVAGGTRRRGHLRHPRRRRAAGLRPAVRLAEAAPRPGPPRAGRRTRRQRIRARHRQGRRVHGDLGSRRHQPGHPAGRRPDGLDPGGRDHRPGRPRPDRHRRLPGSRHLRHHDADHQAQLPRPRRRRHRPGDGRGVPHRAVRPAGRGARRHPQGRAAGAVHVQLAAADRPARLQAEHQAAQPPDPRGRQADRRGPQAGALRRWRRDPRRGHRGAAGPGRADRHPGRHDADGARRVPGQPSAEPGHARHARHGRRGGGTAAQRSADRAGHPIRRPGDGQAGFLRARGQGDPRRHRPGRDRQEPPRRRADRRRRQGRDRRSDRGAAPRRHHRLDQDRQLVGVPARRAVDLPAELRAAE